MMIVILGVIAVNFIGRGLDREFKGRGIKGSTYAVTSIKIIIYIIVFSIGLTQLGVGSDIIPILVTAFAWCIAIGLGAALAAGLGFSLKDSMPAAFYSMGSGKHAFKKGSIIQVGKYKGVVEFFDLSTLVLVNKETNEKHVIPMCVIKNEPIIILNEARPKIANPQPEQKPDVLQNIEKSNHVIIIGEPDTIKAPHDDVFGRMSGNRLVFKIENAGLVPEKQWLDPIMFLSKNEAAQMFNRMLNLDKDGRRQIESVIKNNNTLYDAIKQDESGLLAQFSHEKTDKLFPTKPTVFGCFEPKEPWFLLLLTRLYKHVEKIKEPSLIIINVKHQYLNYFSSMAYLEQMLRVNKDSKIRFLIILDGFPSGISSSLPSFSNCIIMKNSTIPESVVNMLEIKQDVGLFQQNEGIIIQDDLIEAIFSLVLYWFVSCCFPTTC